jgi:hypothetical protein
MPEHQRHADGDGRVGHVEGRPMIAGQVKIEKIDHGIEAQAVDHIA